jgi:hypothetical protein
VEIVEAGVESAAGEEASVVAAFRDAPAVEHDHLRRLAHGREVVRDHDRRPPFHEASQGLHYPMTGAGVQTRSRLVEYENGCVADHRAGDGDALALPAGEEPALLPDHGVVALGQCEDEVVRVGGLRRAGYLLFGRTRLAVGNVLPHGPVEDQRLLQEHGDVLAQRVQGEVLRVVPVEPDGARVRVVEAQQQLGDGGLARPALADQRERLARPDAERDLLERGLPRPRVGERDRVELHDAPRAMERAGPGRVLYRGLAVEELDDPLRPGGGGVDGVQEAAQAPDRAVELAEKDQEDQEPADGERAVRDLVGAEDDHHEHPGELYEVDQGRKERAQAGRGHLGGEPAGVLPVEAGDLGLRPAVSLHERGVGEALLGHRPDRTRPPPFFPGGLLDPAGELPRDEPEERRDEERDERELPVEVEERAHEEDELEEVGEGGGRPGEHQLLDLVYVVRETRDDVAELLPLEKVKREPVQVLEELRAQRDSKAPADPLGEVLV